MRFVLSLFLSVWLLLCPFNAAFAVDLVHAHPPVALEDNQPDTIYYWSMKRIGDTAQLLTLSCRHCGSLESNQPDVPLLSVLRDTLGVGSPENDRLSYVWLLSAGRFTVGQRLLSAVPFFYWKVGSAGAPDQHSYPSPLLDVSAPLHPVVTQASRNILQWAAFDPLTLSLRATSRSYASNQADNERLYLEEAIGYLQNAPVVAGEDGLSEREKDTVLARLELRKSMLGGLLNNQKVAEFGRRSRFADQRICGRNFEVLRQLAEKTGTYFEPLALNGDADSFAILWFPVDTARSASGFSDRPLWKLLNIRDPWSDNALRNWSGPKVQRSLDTDGRLLPADASGVQSITLIPLAVYSLSYPQMPLLMVDFRDKSRVHRHEILQRTITELTSGVLGLSHFANWYYYAGAFAYHALWARQGTASNQAERLDCYAQFRMQLALDHELDPQLRRELVIRAEPVNVNPLDSDPARNVANARLQFARLSNATEGNELTRVLDRDRRAELAAFGQSAKANFVQTMFHFVSFGTYTQRVSSNARNLANLDRDRRISYQLDFLDAATANGTDPRIAVDGKQIDSAIFELNGLLEDVKSASILEKAHQTLARVQTLSHETNSPAKSLQTADSAIIER